MQKKYSNMLILLIVILLTSVIPLSCFADTAKIYYVSTSGNDLNDGLSLSTPFEHIQKAADMMKYGDTCYIRGGTYRETVIPKYSGVAGVKIKYTNYNGEVVTVNGTDLLTNWSLDSGNIYKAWRSMTFSTGNQVFLNGAPMEPARWPNNSSTALFSPTLAVADAGTSTTITDEDLTQVDNYWKDAQVWCIPSAEWASQRRTVISSSQANKRITFGAFTYAPQGGNRYYLTGLKSMLDTEKEWWYDKNSGYVYLWKPGGGSPTTSVVEVKQRACGFDLSSRSYIDITGINFFATGLYTNASTSNCTFDNITARYTMNGDVDIGGIRLYGNNVELKNSTIEFSSKYLVSLAGTSNKVVNCLLQNGDYEAGWDSLIELGGSNHLISHNTVRDAARSCIGGKSFFSCQIQYNEMYNVGRLTKDLGVTYIGNIDGGNTRIHHNIFHDNFDTSKGGGIYLDNHSSNFVIDHNVVWGCKDALRLNSPNNSVLVYNNTLISTVNSYAHWGDGIYAHIANASRIYNNIFSNKVSVPTDAVLGNNLYSNIEPLYVNAAANNYRLTGSSPAKDKGRILNGITDGYADAMPDIGAYEYNGLDWTAGHNFTTPPNPAYSSTSAPYTNLVKNSCFETGNLTNWDTMGAGNATVLYNNAWVYPTGVVQSNYYGLSLGGTEATDGAFQTITGLTPNTTYVVTAWLKVTSGEMVEIGAKNFGGTKKSSQSTSTTWENKKFTFTTGSTNTTADIYLLKNTVTSGYCYADVVIVVPLEMSQSGQGVEDTFSQPDGYIPTLDDGWDISGLVAGDSATVQQGTLRIVKSGSTDGTLTVSKNNLNLDANAGGRITVEFEAQFPDLAGTSSEAKFPVINGIKEDGSGEYGTVNSVISPYRIWTYYYTNNISNGINFLSGLNNNTSAWHKMTYEIDTESDTYTAISDGNIKLTNVGFSKNSKIKSLDNISFVFTKGTVDSVYYIRNFKVIPHILPKVMDSTPINGETLIGTQNSIVLNFNTDMNISTLTNSNIAVSSGVTPTTLTNLATSEYSVTPIIDSITGKCKAVILNFVKNLNNLLEYKVTISGNVLSLDGVAMSSNKEIYIPSPIQVTEFSIAGISTSNITASVRLRNYKEAEQAVDFIVVAYDKVNGKLVGIGKVNETVAPNVAEINMPLSLKLPSVGTNYTIKGYLWNSVSNLKPLKTVIPFQ